MLAHLPAAPVKPLPIPARPRGMVWLGAAFLALAGCETPCEISTSARSSAFGRFDVSIKTLPDAVVTARSPHVKVLSTAGDSGYATAWVHHAALKYGPNRIEFAVDSSSTFRRETVCAATIDVTEKPDILIASRRASAELASESAPPHLLLGCVREPAPAFDRGCSVLATTDLQARIPVNAINDTGAPENEVAYEIAGHKNTTRRAPAVTVPLDLGQVSLAALLSGAQKAPTKTKSRLGAAEPGATCLSLPFSFAYAGGPRRSGHLQLSCKGLKELLEKVFSGAEGGVAFKGDSGKGDSGKGEYRSVYLMKGKVLGPASVVRDLDLLAEAHDDGVAKNDGKGCPYGPEGAFFIPTYFQNVEIVVTDRRTGAKVAQRVFPARAGTICPGVITRKGDSERYEHKSAPHIQVLAKYQAPDQPKPIDAVVVRPKDAEIEAWLESLLR